MMHSVDGGATSVVANAWTNHSQSAESYSELVSVAIINAAVDDKIWPGYHTSYNAPTVTTTWGYNQCVIYLLG